jgi:GAF domain-containing protein
LEQQTAAADVIQVISSSLGELEPVFATMLEKAVHICDAKFGNIYRWDGDALHLMASHNTPAAFAEARGRAPRRPGSETPSGRMIAGKTFVHVSDLAAERAYAARDQWAVTAVEFGGVRTLLVVPMLKENELVGSFTIYRQEVRPFTDKQIELVKNFAAQAVIAVENARLLNELRQSLEQQTAAAEVLQVISSSPGHLEPVFEAMLENAARLCDAKFGNIFRWDGKALCLLATHNTPPAFAEARKRSPLQPNQANPIGHMLATQNTVHISDLAADARYTERNDPDVIMAVELGGIRTFVAVPMVKGRS